MVSAVEEGKQSEGEKEDQSSLLVSQENVDVAVTEPDTYGEPDEDRETKKRKRGRPPKVDKPPKPPDSQGNDNGECIEDVNCPVCKIDVGDVKGLFCDMCHIWFHSECLLITDEEYGKLCDSCDQWFCVGCSAIQSNKFPSE